MKALFHSLTLLLLMVKPLLAQASPASLEELQQADRLLLSAHLIPEEDLVPGQKLKLILEIATDRWFSGGTRIRLPEVSGLVVLQTEQFASNSSENRRGKSWVIQRWTLDVYAQRPGEFTIPPMILELAVNDGASGTVQGQLLSPAVDFTVTLPPALEGEQHWVAAPSFKVEQHFDRDLEGLIPGDAFERQIIVEAADVLAMMLPELTLTDIPGLAAYPAPPELVNRSNRGETIAQRKLTISYVVEAEGEYLLPEKDFLWWDTQSADLQVLSLAPVAFTVGQPVAVSESNIARTRLDRDQWLVITAAALGLLGLLWLLYKLYPRLLLLGKIWQQLAARWRILRQPALPDRLNP